MIDATTELSHLIKGEVATDESTRTAHNHDASIFELEPRAVIYPKNKDDLEQVIAFVRQHRDDHLSLTMRSGGTDMSGGSITESLLVDMTRYFNHILEVGTNPRNAEEGYAVVEPGVYYRDFEKATLAKGFLLPTYPASREICTVGGMAANNSAGEKTLVYGQTIRYVDALKVVLSDSHEYAFHALTKEELDQKMQLNTFEGSVYRDSFKLLSDHYDIIQAARPTVSKNSAGYQIWDVWDKKTGFFDLTKLFVGSQGTLGAITEITYRLVRPKKHSTLLVVFLKDVSVLPKVVNAVLAHHPESFESYDDHTLQLAVKFFPDIVKFFRSSLINLAFQFLPEAWMVLTGGMPKLILMAEFTGDSEEEVMEKARAAQADLLPLHLTMRITASEEEARKYWVIRRESFNLLRKHVSGKRTAPFIDDIVVHPQDLATFLPELDAILKPYDLIYTIAGHIGNGNFHIIPLADFHNPHIKEIIPELSKKVYSLVFKYKGSMTGEHNDGMVRGAYLRDMFGDEIFEIFKKIKHIFDPDDIFNPHKKTNATLEYSMDHVNIE
ncbi:MAG: FAD-binding oxidoreductase [Patescibacteria group bacterium]|nr:FAD-binding oxidoreductase [Patescibacteria group bacterium]MDE2438322.1 FAD-binding oxidoreductase [Patescibacteria group bacterium]